MHKWNSDTKKFLFGDMPIATKKSLLEVKDTHTHNVPYTLTSFARGTLPSVASSEKASLP